MPELEKLFRLLKIFGMNDVKAVVDAYLHDGDGKNQASSSLNRAEKY